MSMSKYRSGWLLAILLCIPLASCVMGDEGEEELDLTEEAAEQDLTDVTAEDCQFSQQCDPCQPPWVQQTAQRVWNECGVTGTQWTIKYYCALCE